MKLSVLMDRIEESLEPYMSDEQCFYLARVLLSKPAPESYRPANDDPLDVDLVLALGEVLDESKSG